MASSQLVHCHACRHRFSWRGGDLACPQCASDMVEILEPPGSISSTPLIPSISSTPSIPSSAPGGGGRSVDPQIPGPAPLAFSTMFELFVDGLVGQMLGSGSRIAARASRVHTRPVSRAVIDGLTEVKVRKAGCEGLEPGAGEAFTVEGDSECAVCHVRFDEGEGLVELSCMHAYHKDCLGPWLARVPTCPVCRGRVV